MRGSELEDHIANQDRRWSAEDGRYSLAAVETPTRDIALIEGRFLEQRLPIRLFATLTVPPRRIRYPLRYLFREYIDELQERTGLTLGYVVTTERASQLHLHAAIVAQQFIDPIEATLVWKAVTYSRSKAAAVIYRYQNGLDGSGYVLKELNSLSTDVEYSHNLAAFSDESNLKSFGRNSKERRQIRRIRSQSNVGQGMRHGRIYV